MSDRVPVGVLGATGMVGETLLRMLAEHPGFRVAEVGASERSAGSRLRDLIDPSALAPDVADLEVKSLDSDWSSPVILSALPASVARTVEPELAGRGHLVVSNASAFRADPGVPLVIPEVNPDHLALVDHQSDRWSGGIVTNPNCVIAGLALAFAPLHRTFGIERASVSTYQAISGAGRPGPAAFDLVDNVIPWIGGEEPKIGAEPRKILGTLGPDGLADATFPVDATAVRVPVLHGHLAAVSLELAGAPGADDVRHAFESFRGQVADLDLPTAPTPPLVVLDGNDRPQPRLDRDRGAGMTVTVGRIRPGEAFHVSFVVLSHNLVRGAAGAALLNAELCRAQGRVPGVPA